MDSKESTEEHPNPEAALAEDVTGPPVAAADPELNHADSAHEQDGLEEAAEDVAVEIVDGVRRIKRLCRYPGCTRVIKSQGHCQRHGAKAKRCRIVGCDKQAQGTHVSERLYLF